MRDTIFILGGLCAIVFLVLSFIEIISACLIYGVLAKWPEPLCMLIVGTCMFQGVGMGAMIGIVLTMKNWPAA